MRGGLRRAPLKVASIVNQEWSMGALIRIIQCPRGANAIEYALVASLIAIAAVAAMQKLGTSVDSMLNNVSNVL
jgi:pilus assembly protein Flp/PilA